MVRIMLQKLTVVQLIKSSLTMSTGTFIATLPGTYHMNTVRPYFIKIRFNIIPNVTVGYSNGSLPSSYPKLSIPALDGDKWSVHNSAARRNLWYPQQEKAGWAPRPTKGSTRKNVPAGTETLLLQFVSQ